MYVIALWWLAPDICRRALALGKVVGARRERVLKALRSVRRGSTAGGPRLALASTTGTRTKSVRAAGGPAQSHR